MDRREFGKALSVGIAGLVAPASILDIKASDQDLGSLIRARFDIVKHKLLAGKSFTSPLLNEAFHNGKIVKILPLGECVEVHFDNGSRKIFDIEQCNVPITWTEEDNRSLARVEVADLMCRNAIYAMDSIITEKLIGAYKLAISHTYNYVLGDVYKTDNVKQISYYRLLYTVYCRIPYNG